MEALEALFLEERGTDCASLALEELLESLLNSNSLVVVQQTKDLLHNLIEGEVIAVNCLYRLLYSALDGVCVNAIAVIATLPEDADDDLISFVRSHGLMRLICACLPEKGSQPDVSAVAFFYRLLRTSDHELVREFISTRCKDNDDSAFPKKKKTTNTNASIASLPLSELGSFGSDCTEAPGLSLLASWIAYFSQLRTFVPACISGLAIADIVIKASSGSPDLIVASGLLHSILELFYVDDEKVLCLVMLLLMDAITARDTFNCMKEHGVFTLLLDIAENGPERAANLALELFEIIIFTYDDVQTFLHGEISIFLLLKKKIQANSSVLICSSILAYLLRSEDNINEFEEEDLPYLLDFVLDHCNTDVCEIEGARANLIEALTNLIESEEMCVQVIDSAVCQWDRLTELDEKLTLLILRAIGKVADLNITHFLACPDYICAVLSVFCTSASFEVHGLACTILECLLQNFNILQFNTPQLIESNDGRMILTRYHFCVRDTVVKDRVQNIISKLNEIRKSLRLYQLFGTDQLSDQLTRPPVRRLSQSDFHQAPQSQPQQRRRSQSSSSSSQPQRKPHIESGTDEDCSGPRDYLLPTPSRPANRELPKPHFQPRSRSQSPTEYEGDGENSRHVSHHHHHQQTSAPSLFALPGKVMRSLGPSVGRKISTAASSFNSTSAGSSSNSNNNNVSMASSHSNASSGHSSPAVSVKASLASLNPIRMRSNSSSTGTSAIDAKRNKLMQSLPGTSNARSLPKPLSSSVQNVSTRAHAFADPSKNPRGATNSNGSNLVSSSSAVLSKHHHHHHTPQQQQATSPTVRFESDAMLESHITIPPLTPRGTPIDGSNMNDNNTSVGVLPAHLVWSSPRASTSSSGASSSSIPKIIRTDNEGEGVVLFRNDESLEEQEVMERAKHESTTGEPTIPRMLYPDEEEQLEAIERAKNEKRSLDSPETKMLELKRTVARRALGEWLSNPVLADEDRFSHVFRAGLIASSATSQSATNSASSPQPAMRSPLPSPPTSPRSLPTPPHVPNSPKSPRRHVALPSPPPTPRNATTGLPSPPVSPRDQAPSAINASSNNNGDASVRRRSDTLIDQTCPRLGRAPKALPAIPRAPQTVQEKQLSSLPNSQLHVSPPSRNRDSMHVPLTSRTRSTQDLLAGIAEIELEEVLAEAQFEEILRELEMEQQARVIDDELVREEKEMARAQRELESYNSETSMTDVSPRAINYSMSNNTQPSSTRRELKEASESELISRYPAFFVSLPDSKTIDDSQKHQQQHHHHDDRDRLTPRQQMNTCDSFSSPRCDTHSSMSHSPRSDTALSCDEKSPRAGVDEKGAELAVVNGIAPPTLLPPESIGRKHGRHQSRHFQQQQQLLTDAASHVAVDDTRAVSPRDKYAISPREILDDEEQQQEVNSHEPSREESLKRSLCISPIAIPARGEFSELARDAKKSNESNRGEVFVHPAEMDLYDRSDDSAIIRSPTTARRETKQQQQQQQQSASIEERHNYAMGAASLGRAVNRSPREKYLISPREQQQQQREKHQNCEPSSSAQSMSASLRSPRDRGEGKDREASASARKPCYSPRGEVQSLNRAHYNAMKKDSSTPIRANEQLISLSPNGSGTISGRSRTQKSTETMSQSTAKTISQASASTTFISGNNNNNASNLSSSGGGIYNTYHAKPSQSYLTEVWGGPRRKAKTHVRASLKDATFLLEDEATTINHCLADLNANLNSPSLPSPLASNSNSGGSGGGHSRPMAANRDAIVRSSDGAGFGLPRSSTSSSPSAITTPTNASSTATSDSEPESRSQSSRHASFSTQSSTSSTNSSSSSSSTASSTASSAHQSLNLNLEQHREEKLPREAVVVSDEKVESHAAPPQSSASDPAKEAMVEAILFEVQRGLLKRRSGENPERLLAQAQARASLDAKKSSGCGSTKSGLRRPTSRNLSQTYSGASSRQFSAKILSLAASHASDSDQSTASFFAGAIPIDAEPVVDELELMQVLPIPQLPKRKSCLTLFNADSDSSTNTNQASSTQRPLTSPTALRRPSGALAPRKYSTHAPVTNFTKMVTAPTAKCKPPRKDSSTGDTSNAAKSLAISPAKTNTNAPSSGKDQQLESMTANAVSTSRASPNNTNADCTCNRDAKASRDVDVHVQQQRRNSPGMMPLDSAHSRSSNDSISLSASMTTTDDSMQPLIHSSNNTNNNNNKNANGSLGRSFYVGACANSVADSNQSRDDREEAQLDAEAATIINIQLRRKVVLELLKTEETYVNSLEVLINDIKNPLTLLSYTKKALITNEEIQTIFSVIDIIYNYNFLFLEELKERVSCWNADSQVSDIFLFISHFFKAYTEYINNYENSVQTLRNCVDRNVKFEKWLEGASKRPSCNGHQLSSFLIMPIQRIPRYEMLLKELKTCTEPTHADYENLTLAIHEIRSINCHLNEKKKQFENNSEFLEIVENLTGKLATSLVQPNRQFIYKEQCNYAICKLQPDKRGNTVRGVGTFLIFNDCCAVSKVEKRSKKLKLISLIPYEDVMSIKQKDRILCLKYLEHSSGVKTNRTVNVTEFRLSLGTALIMNTVKDHLETAINQYVDDSYS